MNDWPETKNSLILRVKNSADEAAWAGFLAIYRPVVFRLALQKGLQHADAEDLTQRVFLSISRAVENWQPDDAGPPFRAWLFRIAHNEILKTITRRKPDTATGSTSVQGMLRQVHDGAEDASERLIHHARQEAFAWAAGEIRDQFTTSTWAMFWQSTVEDQPVEDVAKAHGRSTGAVYLARFRVMKKLKTKLNEVSDIWSVFS